MRELQYHNGRVMRFDPINTTDTAIIDLLSRGQPAVAILEPGDATRYTLLLVPASAPGVRDELRHFGIPPHMAEDMLLVVQLNDEGGRAAWVPIDGPEVETWTVAAISNNAWTHELVAWWLTELLARWKPAEEKDS